MVGCDLTSDVIMRPMSSDLFWSSTGKHLSIRDQYEDKFIEVTNYIVIKRIVQPLDGIR